MNNNKQGISLVALVITIIVLIILTGAVILSLGGEKNIIDNGQAAVIAHNQKVMAEAVLVEVANYKIAAIQAGQSFSEYVIATEATANKISGTRAETGYVVTVDATGAITYTKDNNRIIVTNEGVIGAIASISASSASEE